VTETTTAAIFKNKRTCARQTQNRKRVASH
jgi:hypothetical protein